MEDKIADDENCGQARDAIKRAVMALVHQGFERDHIADALIGTAVQMLVQYTPRWAVAGALRETANKLDRPN